MTLSHAQIFVEKTWGAVWMKSVCAEVWNNGRGVGVMSCCSVWTFPNNFMEMYIQQIYSFVKVLVLL